MAYPSRLKITLSPLWPILTALLMTLVQSCKKDDVAEPHTQTPNPPTSSVTLRVEPYIDGADLRFNTMMYITPNNLPYSVSRAEYYISRIVMHGANATPNDTLHGPFHMASAGPKDFSLGAMAAGEYSGANFCSGSLQC